MKQSLFSAIPSVNYKGKNAKLQYITFQYLTGVLIINMHPETRWKATLCQASYKMSQVLHCSISAQGQERGGLLVLRAMTKSPFHISLEHFRNGWTINNFRKATPSLKAISALLSLVLVQLRWTYLPKQPSTLCAQAALRRVGPCQARPLPLQLHTSERSVLSRHPSLTKCHKEAAGKFKHF